MREAKSLWSSWADVALDWLYPPKCCLCGMIGELHLCSVCEADFVETTEPIERAYGRADLDYWACAYQYTGRAAQAVQRLKYSRSTALANPMADVLLRFAEFHGLLEVDAIVPVPIHWRRRCRRGFNQAELLASQMPKEKVQPRLLTRIKSTRPQVGLTREQRLENLKGAFRAEKRVLSKRILLIDDVLTSGQTARECARELKSKGAAEVGVLVFAGPDYLGQPYSTYSWSKVPSE